jgi:hypothetical protein
MNNGPASPNRRAGIFYLKMDGVLMDSVGEFTYRVGTVKREMIPGNNQILGFSEELQVPYIEGSITDKGTLDVEALCNAVDATGILELPNGKTYTLKNACYAGEGTIKTAKAEINFRLEGMDGFES